MKRKNLLVYLMFIVAILIIALPLASCAGSGSTASITTAETTAASTTTATSAAETTATETTAGSTTEATTPSGTGGQAINIESFLFNPDSLTIKVGETVTWTNNDSVSHTITEDKGVFDSGSINSGATFSFTFKTAGTFSYHCTIHSSMTGKIIVQ
jgi:plastocyanin